MKIQNLMFSGLMLGLSFATYAGDNNNNNKVEAAKAESPAQKDNAANDQIYQVTETPGGSVVFTGTADAVNDYSDENYPSCNSGTANCTYVYKDGTAVRETSLERHHE